MATAILSILATPITELGKCLFVPLKRQISYLINYEKNLDNLRVEAISLRGKRNDVQNLVQEAGRRLEQPTEEVQDWLRRADDIEADLRKLNGDASQNTRCLKGLCPDWSSRRRLSKQAVEKFNVVKELRERGNVITISHVPPPPSVELVRTDCVENFASRELVMDKVMKALRDVNISSIGIHGMGGVGKTTLVNRLNNDLQETQLFKKVIMVTVSSNPDWMKIEDGIGNRLGLKFEPQSTELERKNKLFERLKKEETVLIILDDVWNRFKVEDIGIPTRTEHIGCKIILTTRIFDVCREMGMQTIIQVELLSEEESWNLFKTKVGDVVTSHERLQPIAQEIARKCQGSPLAIVALGSSLRSVEEEFEWSNALRALKSPEPMEIDGIMPEVITSLRFSYDHLNGPEIKLCFLYCCLFPEDYDIHLIDLGNYGIGEGFLEVNGTLEDARNKLLSYVKKLKNSGLLLDGSYKHSVKMHDVVRDVAISIASKDENRFLVKAGVQLIRWTERENLNRYKRISFARSVGIELPSPLECPQLLTLSLAEVKDVKINPDNFFEGMKSLLVLDLHSTMFTSIPQSIVHLTKLRTLDLSWCDLSTNISILGGLKNLEILDLRGSEIVKLPEELGNLTNLKCLILAEANISIVTPNVLSRLSKLEELYMQYSFADWDMVTQEDKHNASFAEVASLPHLNTLRIDIRGKICMSQDIPFLWKNLKEFQVRVYTSSNFRLKEHENSLYLDGVDLSRHWAKVLFKRTKWLQLSDCKGFNNVADLDTVGVFKHLEYLNVEGCDEVEYLISIGEAQSPQASFGVLKNLEIKFMCNMKKIFHGIPPIGLFGQLKVLNVLYCPNVINIFSLDLLQNLTNLEEFKVKDCHVLQEVFNAEGFLEPEGNHAMPMLSRLRTITLSDLNNLKSIWKGVLSTGSFQQLNRLEICSCHMMEKILSSGKEEGEEHVLGTEDTSSSRQRQLHTRTNFLNLESPKTFQNLQYLIIEDCRPSKKLFSFSLAQGFQRLETLYVSNCYEVEEIIANEDGQDEGVARGLLPRLRLLRLEDLHDLTSIYQGSLLLDCLEHMEIEVVGCPKLKRLPIGPQGASKVRITGEKEWFEGLEWEDENIKSSLQVTFTESDKIRGTG